MKCFGLDSDINTDMHDKIRESSVHVMVVRGFLDQWASDARHML